MNPSRRRNALSFASLAALAAFVSIPATLTFMAETADAQSLAAGLLPAAALPAAAAATTQSTLRLAALPDALPDIADFAAADDAVSAPAAAARDDDLVCMAKVIVHEARNQPRAGQLAVAQVILARIASGRFADTVCGVVNQRGQFFDTASYEPDRQGAAWANAVAVSREAIEGAAHAVPGALFYHAAYQAPTSFFRTRQRVAMLGDHIFYR